MVFLFWIVDPRYLARVDIVVYRYTLEELPVFSFPPKKINSHMYVVPTLSQLFYCYY